MENIFVCEPKTGRTAKLPLLLALNGNASSAAASLDAWQPATNAGWLVALPQSTRVDEDGEYIWNPLMRNEWPVTEIQNHYQQLLEQYPIDPEQVMLSGFSMGVGLAIWLALRRYIRARGFLVVAPYLPYEYVEAPEMTITPSNPLRGYVVVGEPGTLSIWCASAFFWGCDLLPRFFWILARSCCLESGDAFLSADIGTDQQDR